MSPPGRDIRAAALELHRLARHGDRWQATPSRHRQRPADPPRSVLGSRRAPQTVSVIIFARELDLAAVSGFERQLDSASLARPQQIVLDMHRVEFMDCGGLGAIEAARVRLGDRGIRLTLCSLGPQPLWLVRFAGLGVAVEL